MTVVYIYCVNCMKFGQLILRKVIQIVATRCHILRLKRLYEQANTYTCTNITQA